MKKSKKDGEYFDKLFNGNSTQDLNDLTIQCQDMNHSYMSRISESEVKDALKWMKSRKAIGPDGILIEVWRCLEAWFKVSVSAADSAGTETDRSWRLGSDSDDTRKTLHRTPKKL